jgi:hypothetical protein
VQALRKQNRWGGAVGLGGRLDFHHRHGKPSKYVRTSDCSELYEVGLLHPQPLALLVTQVHQQYHTAVVAISILLLCVTPSSHTLCLSQQQLARWRLSRADSSQLIGLSATSSASIRLR